MLDSIPTEERGEAKLIFENDYRFTSHESRIIRIDVLYKGNDIYRIRSSDIETAQVSMELFLSEINDLKTIAVRGYELGLDNAMVPITEAKVSFYVPRYFSNQKNR